MRHKQPILLLILVFAIGYDSMWGYTFRNGYYDDLVYLRDVGPHLLPGSNIPLQKQYIGVELIDYWLTVLQATFANFLDGSVPGFSIYAFHFAGQLVPVITVMYIESSRQGNCKNITSLFLPWTIVMQSIGYGIVMPTWCLIHLATSKTAQDDLHQPTSIKPRDDITLRTLPFTIILGYVAPAVAMTLTTFSPPVHQYLVAIWQVFPLWLVILQYSAGMVASYLPGPRQSNSDNALYNCYRFGFAFAMGTHLISLGLVAFISWSPPATFSSVFVPPYFRNHAPIANMVQGAQAVFQYDQYNGSLAALIWSVALRTNSHKISMSLIHFAQVLVEVVIYTIISGPTGAVIMMVWTRDHATMTSTAQNAKTK